MTVLTAARGGSRSAATSKTEHFVVIVNSWKLLPIITKSFIFDVAAVLDLPLGPAYKVSNCSFPKHPHVTLVMQIFKGLKAATGGVLYQKVLKISQNSQENTYTRVSFLIKLQA